MIGILHTKDLFQVFAEEQIVILEDAVRPVTFIRPDLPVTDGPMGGDDEPMAIRGEGRGIVVAEQAV